MKKMITILVTLGLIIATVAVVNAQLGSDSVTHNTSWVFQNLGSSTADVAVELYSTDGTLAASDSFTVAKSVAFWAPDYAPLDAVGTFNGSIVASSNQPLAATSNQVAQNTTSGKSGNATYVGFTGDTVAPTMYAPVLMKSYAGIFWTEMSIQSTASSGSTAVSVHYYNEDGSEVTGSPVAKTVPAGSPIRVAQADEAILSDGWIGSVKVAADDGTTALALVVNEFWGGANHEYDQFYSYEGFASGATRVVCPNVFINGYGGLFQASATVQNLGSVPADVTFTFYDNTAGNPNQATAIYSFTQVITTSLATYYPNAPYAQDLKDGYNVGDDEWIGTVVFESTNGQPLAAIVNELSGSYWAASFTGLTAGGTEFYSPMAYVKGYGFANTSYAIVDTSGTSGVVNVTVDYIADTVACPGCSDWSDTYDFEINDNKYQPDHIPASAMDNGTYIGAIKITVNTAGKTIGGVINEILGSSTADYFTSFNGTAQ